MICTDDRELFERCVAYGFYERTGVASRYNDSTSQISDQDLIRFRGLPIGGVKYRINQTCSAMGRVQLRHYPERIAEIDRAMNTFCDLLEEIPGLSAIRPPAGGDTTKGGWYNAKGVMSRELAEQADSYQFAAALRAEGVVTGGGYNAPLHLHPVFHELDFFRQGRPTVLAFGQRDVRQGPGSLPVAETLHCRIFDLPWFKHFDPEAIRLHAEAFRKVVDNIGELK